MTIVDGDCWKCHSKMKVAILEGGQDRRGSHLGPEKFTAEEIKFARDKGVLIKEHYSKTVRARYLANTCAKCGTFVGNHTYLHAILFMQLAGNFLLQDLKLGIIAGIATQIKSLPIEMSRLYYFDQRSV